MSRRLDQFAWPTPPGSASPPRWDGENFVIGARCERILQFHETPSHWSAELTALHEAEAGATHPIDVASRKLAIDSLRRFAAPPPLVLDIGCSSGFLIHDLRQAIPGSAVIGSDYLLEPLRSAAQRLPGVPLLQFDLRQCPLPDASLDAVTALNVLEHIDDDALALRQIFRILRLGGVAHIEVPAGPHLYDIYDEQLMHHRRYRRRDLVALARGAGFSVLRATHLGALVYPAFAIAKKRNRRLRQLSAEDKQRTVASQIRKTSHSRLLKMILEAELAVGRRVRYPCGIRCIAVLRKA